MRKIKKEAIVGILFILPYAILWFIFLVWPVIYGFYISLHRWDPLRGSKFIGLKNYIKLFHDPRFWNALMNTFEFSLISIPLIVGIGLFFALILYKGKIKGTPIIEASFFFPYLLNVSIISLLWRWLLDPDFGIVPYYLGLLGLKVPVFLNDERWVIPAIAIATAWWLAGYRIVIFRAALQDIPPEIFEAADIDGAEGISRLRFVTMPLIKPSILFAVVLTSISAFRVLGQVMIMTNGGPGRASEVLTLYLYRYAFQYFKMGRAAAVGVFQFMVILFVTLLAIKFIGLKSEL